MDVRNIVERTLQKYQTRSPYELADRLGVMISRCELGSIRGYYLKKYRIKQIVLNCNLNSTDEEFVLAHEIGHSILHPDHNTPFLLENTYMSKSKYECEANKFAIELLVPDEIFRDNPEYTMEQFSRLTGYAEELIRLRIN